MDPFTNPDFERFLQMPPEDYERYQRAYFAMKDQQQLGQQVSHHMASSGGSVSGGPSSPATPMMNHLLSPEEDPQFSTQEAQEFAMQSPFLDADEEGDGDEFGGVDAGGRWTVEEDLILISAMLFVSKDARKGADQKGDKYWNRIARYFNNPMNNKIGKVRKPNSCRCREKRINKEVMKWRNCWAQIVRDNPSGWDDVRIRKAAQILYKDKNNGKAFTLDHCWEQLRWEPKWAPKISSGVEGEGSASKRTRVGEDGFWTASGSGSENPTPEQRPPGQKASKAKSKGKGMASTSTDVPVQNLSNRFDQVLESRQGMQKNYDNFDEDLKWRIVMTKEEEFPEDEREFFKKYRLKTWKKLTDSAPPS